jgi:hypothetical protein
MEAMSTPTIVLAFADLYHGGLLWRVSTANVLDGGLLPRGDLNSALGGLASSLTQGGQKTKTPH